MVLSPHPDDIITSGCERAVSITFNYSHNQTASVDKPRHCFSCRSRTCQSNPNGKPNSTFFFPYRRTFSPPADNTVAAFLLLENTRHTQRIYSWSAPLHPATHTYIHLHTHARAHVRTHTHTKLSQHIPCHHPWRLILSFSSFQGVEAVEKPRWLQLFFLPARRLLIRLRSY